MIDEKKIKQAAIECADEYYSLDFEKDREETNREIFIRGAHWTINEFLKDLWHQTDEKPEGYDEWILLHYNVGNFYSLAQVKDFKSWEGFVERAPIEKWLYIDDLLPKKGGAE